MKMMTITTINTL